MGSDRCTLEIGQFKFEWRDYLPDYLLFMFTQEDKCLARDEGSDYYDFLGYKTITERAKPAFDRLGYDIQFVCGVYDHFHADIEEQYLQALQSEANSNDANRKKIAKKCLKNYKQGSRLDDINQFISFCKTIAARDFTDSIFAQPYEWGYEHQKPQPASQFLGGDARWNSNTDFNNVLMYAIQKCSVMPPSVVKLAFLFSEWFMFEYADVLALALSRILLECSKSDGPVSIEISDFVEDEEQLGELHSETPWRLSKKVELYNRLFRMFSQAEPEVRSRIAKQSAQAALQNALSTTDGNEKWNHLEDALQQIFQAHPDLIVVSKRYDTNDEEIDLVVKNNVSKPFWINLGSPLIFVECKNWKIPVGASECRDFEVKLLNHNALTRLGVFVAVHGFTDGFRTSLQRMSRNDKVIAIVDGDDLRMFCESDDDLLTWLESRICKFS